MINIPILRRKMYVGSIADEVITFLNRHIPSISTMLPVSTKPLTAGSIRNIHGCKE
jgi:hypothetical protein